MRYLIPIIFLTFLFACKNQSDPTLKPDEDISAALERLSRQIETNLHEGDHEAYIHDFIMMLDYVQQLPSASPARLDAILNLLHYSNKIGLYSHGIALINEALIATEHDTGDSMLNWKERLYAAKAGIYFELHEYALARQSFAKDLYYKELQFPGSVPISTLNNIGMTFQEEGLLDSAMNYFRKVESVLNAPKSEPLLGEFKNDEIFSGSVKDNIASILIQQQQFSEAEALYRENFFMYRKYADQHPFRLINAGIQLARVQLEMEKSIQAENTIDVLDSLFKILSYPGKREHELDFYQLLSRYFSVTGASDSVMYFQQASIHLADSLYGEQLDRIKLVSEELHQYNARQFQQALAHEKREAWHLQQKAKSRFLILLLFIIFSTSGGILLVISLRQRLRLARKQSELNETERKLSEAHARSVEQEKIILDAVLQQKTKDISTLALNARIKKEWAEKLDSLLSQAEQNRGHLRSLALRKLRDEIRIHMHADHRIDKLHENIETLNAAFYDHLNARNPDLSKTEVRLVSFLKLRLSNDEIAMIQGISAKSVIMSRYRLKKKLALPETADLDAFCQEL